MQSSHGLFITFEGGEGAGKTTLMEQIVQKLSADGYRVLKTREPGGTKLGERIRQLLLEQNKEDAPVSPYAELSLFLASRAQHIQEVIEPALQEGKIVLCDRFNDSSVAYQGAARGLGMEPVAAACEFISQGLKPHLTLYLDIDPEQGLKRVRSSRSPEQIDRIESETIAFHAKIRQAYLAIHKKESRRFRLIDASRPPQEVFQDAMHSIQPLLARSTYV